MMHIGHTKRTANRYKCHMWRDTVPLLVNSRCTSRRGTIHPISTLVRKAPSGMSICAVKKSQQSSSDLPLNTNASDAPHDSAHIIPITQHIAVSIVAPVRRDTCSSSYRKAVPISCMEMVDVSAASARSM